MSENNRSGASRTLVSVLITAVFAVLYFYFSLPAINLRNPDFYGFIAVCLVFYVVVAMLVGGAETETSGGYGLREYLDFAKSQCKVVVILFALLIGVFIIGQAIGTPILRANSYHELLDVETGDFSTEVSQVSYDEIPMLDESSAIRLGTRKLGELADMVSQFEILNEYTQINYNGSPVRVASLVYGDIFKWFNNQSDGLPGYVMVDMVTQNVEIIRMADLGLDGIKYSPSEYFFRDLDRALRIAYPTYMFREAHLEIDENGEPWWVAPRETRTIGLFGGADVIGAVLMNASTGETVYYELDEVPTWVDRVFDAELITAQYNYYGAYINGFLNSIFGQQDVTVTTTGSNYIAMNGDVYMYTGITSVSSDDSNIGFLLSNQRTKETTFYSAPGAIETSAQGSAQGVVQDLGYTATFPLLLNISGEPTYFMSLKDSSDLVKMYAMVNVSQYQLVATGNTVAACEAAYIDILNGNGFNVESNTTVDTSAHEDVTGVIAEIRSAVMSGDTYYFIRLEGGEVFYSVKASVNTALVIMDVGDTITINSPADEDNVAEILEAYSVAFN